MTACATGKRRWASERAAKQARQGRTIGARLRVYRCPNCHGWHLSNSHNSGGTHRPRRRKDRHSGSREVTHEV